MMTLDGLKFLAIHLKLAHLADGNSLENSFYILLMTSKDDVDGLKFLAINLKMAHLAEEMA